MELNLVFEFLKSIWEMNQSTPEGQLFPLAVMSIAFGLFAWECYRVVILEKGANND
jgi:hypothetical protein